MGLVVIAGQLGATVASLSTSWFMSIEQDLGFSHQVVLTLFIFVGMLVVYFQPGGAYVGLEQRRPPDLETIKDIKTEEKIDELNNEDMNSQLATKESVELDDNNTLGTTLKGDDQQDEGQAHGLCGVRLDVLHHGYRPGQAKADQHNGLKYFAHFFLLPFLFFPCFLTWDSIS